MTLETTSPIPPSRALIPRRPIPRSHALIAAIRRSPWLTPLAGAGALTAGIVANHGLRLAAAALSRVERSAPPPSTPVPPVEVVQLPPEALLGLSRLVITNVTVIERRRSSS